MLWTENNAILARLLAGLSVHDLDGQKLDPQTGFQLWRALVRELAASKGTVFFAGNGASASMASHFATDLAKNGHIRTRVFTDLSLITALGNDLCYEEVFAEPLRWYMEPGDLLVAVSSSGNSPNIVRAVDTARQYGGRITTLSAMKPDNAIRSRGDINFYVEADTYGMAETAHAAILHYWMDLMEQSRADGMAT